MESELVFRLIIVGDTGVGKSCLVLRFSENKFNEEHNVTIGVEFGTKILRVDKQIVKLQIWDTAGQESFRSITRSFYRRADGVMLVYDVNSRQSFENCDYWLDQIRQNASLGIVICLIGNQVDLAVKDQTRQVTTEEARDFAHKMELSGFMETSAKSGFQVDESFTSFVKPLIAKWEQKNKNAPGQNPSVIRPAPSKQKKKCC